MPAQPETDTQMTLYLDRDDVAAFELVTAMASMVADEQKQLGSPDPELDEAVFTCCMLLGLDRDVLKEKLSEI